MFSFQQELAHAMHHNIFHAALESKFRRRCPLIQSWRHIPLRLILHSV